MALRPYIAKTRRPPSDDPMGPVESRSLLGHCADVAFAFERLVTPRLQFLLGVNKGQLARLCVIAGLHDLGKADRRWQDYIWSAAGGPPARRFGHVAPAINALLASDPDLVSALGDVVEWIDDPANCMFTAMSHHGGPVPEDVWKATPCQFDAAAIAEIRRIADALIDQFPLCREPTDPIHWRPEVEHLFAGLLMMADWRASSLPLVGPEIRRKYVRASISDHLPRDIADPDLGITSWRPMQEAVAEVPLSRLMLIEDMTGSGKTEAAMRLAVRHLEAGNAESIRFCVPMRSAASQLYERITKLAQAAMPGAKVVRALPGELEMDGYEGEGPRPWALMSARHTGVSNVAVGTIDQALLGILRVRGAWARRAMDQRAVLVIDEVHAGDAYMIALVNLLVEHHPGPVILLTATLGREARQRLVGDIEACAPYPAIWSGATAHPVQAVSPREYQVEIREEPSALNEMLSAFRSGATVLVIRSTVADALTTLDLLRQVGLDPQLHHSRYAPADRLYLDGRALGILGPDRPAGRPGMVVATQTLQQSLDIDADLLVTDLCPADDFLQRAGRLHRHRRARPAGCEVARVILLDPGDMAQYLTGSASWPQRGRASNGWAWVYPVLSCAGTIERLRKKPIIRLPEDSREFVDAATCDLGRFERRGERWVVASNHGMGSLIAASAMSRQVFIDPDRPYSDTTIDPERVVLARDGRLPVAVRTDGLISPFTGAQIESLSIDARWLPNGDLPRDDNGAFIAEVEGETIHIGNELLVYNALGLRRRKVGEL
ncbi:MAG: CRISPR-associated helicase Cas3' [Paracoccaceae bacterium]